MKNCVHVCVCARASVASGLIMYMVKCVDIYRPHPGSWRIRLTFFLTVFNRAGSPLSQTPFRPSEKIDMQGIKAAAEEAFQNSAQAEVVLLLLSTT